MNKTIEKIENYKAEQLEKALAKAQKEYDEANRSFYDTGYDRYYNKMLRVEKEIEELTAYKDRDKAITKSIIAENKCKKELEEIKKTLSNKIFYLLQSLPECSEANSLQAFVDNL